MPQKTLRPESRNQLLSSMNFCELILKNDSNLILSAVGVFTLQKSLKTKDYNPYGIKIIK
jgi:hypothetical protein